MTPEADSFLRANLGGSVTGNCSTSSLSSFQVGGPADFLVEPVDEKDLEVISETIRRFGLSYLVLGKGSNVLISDAGFPGIVIKLAAGFDWVRRAGDTVEAGGAASLPRVANWSARRGLSGLEFAVAIPATVGGSVRMNAGAHGKSLADVLVSARIFRLTSGKGETIVNADLGFTYRGSVVSTEDIVCSADFLLAPGDVEQIQQAMGIFRRHRIKTQPAKARNAGSMFKNPEGTSAARLIEEAGLKGTRIGGAQISPKHANFILAETGARAQNIFDLMVEVQSRVDARSGIVLIPEVKLIGSFEDSGRLRVP